MKTLLAIVMTSLTLTAWALPEGKVVLLKGTATFDGQPLKENGTISKDGVVEVGEKSYLKIVLSESRHTIALGANTSSSLKLAADADSPTVNLTRGIVRWITGSGAKSKTGGIRTQNAAMGIRGTDFFVSYDPLLGETELVCFDGMVHMGNVKKAEDYKVVGKNQWGGLGGRFGNSIGDLLTLPANVISHFNERLPR